MKLSLGTAQFGMKYGVTNKNKISNSDISKIFYFMKNNLYKNIDTAADYGSSEEIIGKFNSNDFFNISTKIFIPKKNYETNYLLKNTNSSLIKTKASHFKTLFLHNPNILLYSNEMNKLIISDLKNLKKNKLIKSIGFSVYNPKEVKKLVKIFKPDIIQAPVNIFDQRFIQNDFLLYLNKLDIKLQVRSIFLQGVLFMSLDEFNAKFPNFKSVFKKYKNYLEIKNLSVIENTIRFIKTKKIHSLVFGVNSHKHLQDFVYLYKKRIINPNKNYNYPILNNRLINPTKWS